jgi:hypothetical protein
MRVGMMSLVLWATLLSTHPALAAENANSGTRSGTGGGANDPAAQEVAPPARLKDAAVEKQVGYRVPDSSLSEGICLKEGEQCNPLNDKCCYGYYCTGGLVTRCARKL